MDSRLFKYPTKKALRTQRDSKGRFAPCDIEFGLSWDEFCAKSEREGWIEEAQRIYLIWMREKEVEISRRNQYKLDEYVRKHWFNSMDQSKFLKIAEIKRSALKQKMEDGCVKRMTQCYMKGKDHANDTDYKMWVGALNRVTDGVAEVPDIKDARRLKRMPKISGTVLLGCDTRLREFVYAVYKLDDSRSNRT